MNSKKNNEMKTIQSQLSVLEKKKKAVNVFDEARNNSNFKRHRNDVKNVKKKIDNQAPEFSSSKFFPRKLKNAQHQLEQRLKMNESLINQLNLMHRSKGMVDCYNPNAVVRYSKLDARIREQAKIESDNEYFSKNLKKVEPTNVSNAKILREDWKMIYRRSILLNTKYPIAINSLRTIDCDPFLTDPLTEIEFKKSKKVFFNFHLADHGKVGRIVVMLNSNHEPEIVDMFIERCVTTGVGYQGCKVFKIIEGLLMEAGDGIIELTNDNEDVKVKSLFPNSLVSGDHRFGSLAMLRNYDGSVSSNFCVTFKKLSILNGKQVVIGRVIKGLDVLKAINCYGSKLGVPKKTIFIKSCGMIE